MRRRKARLSFDVPPVMTTIEVGGESIDVIMDSDLTFYAEVDGERHEAASAQALTSKLRALVRQLAVSIPALDIRAHHGGVEITPLTIVGIHEGNGNLLVKNEDGTTSQKYTSRKLCRPLTDTEMRSLKQLAKSLSEAENRFERFVTDREFDPHKAVVEARKRAKL